MTIRSCPVCAADEGALLYDRGRGKTFDTRVCDSCGFAFVPDLAHQEGGYRKHDDRQLDDDSIHAVLAKEQRAIGMAERRFENIRKNASDIIKSKGRMHDIGASLGFFMKHWADAGFEVTGSEPDAYYAAIGEKHFGVKIFPSLFEEKISESSSYDVITMCHVLEHCPDPGAVLDRVWEELKSEGLVYIEVPQIGRPYSGNLDKFFWVEHLNYFSLATLDGLLRQHGFKLNQSGDLGYFLWVVAEKSRPEELSVLPLDTPRDVKDRTLLNLFHYYEKRIKELEKKFAALEKRVS